MKFNTAGDAYNTTTLTTKNSTATFIAPTTIVSSAKFPHYLPALNASTATSCTSLMARSSANTSFPLPKAAPKSPSINLTASTARTTTSETMILVFANSTLLTAPYTANIAPPTQAPIFNANAFQASSSGGPKNVSPVP